VLATCLPQPTPSQDGYSACSRSACQLRVSAPASLRRRLRRPPTVRYRAILPSDVLLPSVRESYPRRRRDDARLRETAQRAVTPRELRSMSVERRRVRPEGREWCTARMAVMSLVPEPRESGGGSTAVARVLATNALCIECIVSRTGLDLEGVLGAVSALESQVSIVRTWGRCPACSNTGRTVLRLYDMSGSDARAGTEYDARERHTGVRCGKCWKPIALGGQRVVLRHGQPYHTACIEGPSRVREPAAGSAAEGDPVSQWSSVSLLCTCSHSRDRHQWEKARRAWTVCRACRCVRFTPTSPRSSS
jgi:hypothetical protein